MGSRAESWFISHTAADGAWAEWVAWQLEDAGIPVWLAAWGLRSGADWTAELSSALLDAGQMVALVSAAYTKSAWARQEREAARNAGIPLLPVLIDDAPPPLDIGHLQTIRLTGLDARAARETLLHAVAPNGPQVVGRLRRLGATGPRLPGSLPRVWNVPPRSDDFVGRDDLLTTLRETLTGSSRAVLVGDPGMGKSRLAVEYAHRFAGDYDLLWWVKAGERPVHPQLIDLSVRIGAATPDLRATKSLGALYSELRVRSRWLLVLDDTPAQEELPLDLRQLLQNPGSGQVLLTTREPSWLDHPEAIEVGPLAPAESSALLRSLLPTLSEADATGVASDLAEMPLALKQAASMIGLVGVHAYRSALSDETGPDSAPHVLAHTVRLSQERLAAEHPVAAALLSACALLSPQPFPLRKCVRDVAWASEQLSGLLRTPGELGDALDAIARLSLARTTDGTVRIHPATQAALRDQLSAVDRATAALDAQALLLSALPPRSAPPEAWAPLLPHLLAIAPEDLTEADVRLAALDACLRHLENGEAPAAVRRLAELRENWMVRLGPEAVLTMQATSYLARGLHDAGDPQAARPLTEEVLAWERARLGDEHPETLLTAAQLTTLLTETGDPERASALGTETLATLRTTLGPDHPSALGLSSSLVMALRELGRTSEAVNLCENTLDRQRRVLGTGHPDTLATAARLAALHEDAGELDAARNLREDIVFWLKRTLGPDNPATLRAVVALASSLDRLGDHEAARKQLEDILRQQMRSLGREHADTMATAAALAGLLSRMDRLEAARELAEQLVDARRRSLGADAVATLANAAFLAGLLLRLDNVTEALELSRDTLDRQRRVLGPDAESTLRTATLLAACLERDGQNTAARELWEDTQRRGHRVLSWDAPLAEHLRGWIGAAVLDPEQEGVDRTDSTQPPQPTSKALRGPLPGQTSVLVSYVNEDRSWAEWVRHELADLGHHVTMEAEDTHTGRPLSREADIVLALLSPGYLESMAAASWTTAEWSELASLDATSQQRFVPLFVKPVSSDQLPRALAELVTPALHELDPDAARQLLRHTLDNPSRTTQGPAFPGASEPAERDQDLLLRHLVNALQRTATLQREDGRLNWLSLIGVPMRFSQGEVSLRTTLYEVVRTLNARPEGMTTLADALEVVEPGSLAVAEVRRIAREIERRKEIR